MMTKAVFIGGMTAVAAAGINTGTIDGWHNMAYVSSSETNMGATEAVSLPGPVTETVYITTTCLATVTVTAQCETGEGPVETFPPQTVSETVPNPVTTPIDTAAVPPPVSTAIKPSIETSTQPTPSPPAAETAPPQFASASNVSLSGVSAVVAVLASFLSFVM